VARGHEKCNAGEKGVTRKGDVVEKERKGDEKKVAARRQKRAEYFLCLIFFCQYTNCGGNKGGKKGKNGRGRVEEREDDPAWWPPSVQGSWTKRRPQNKETRSRKGTTTLT
jgi:hypothetical protein